MTSTARMRVGEWLRYEPGGWMTLRRRRDEFETLDDLELLRLGNNQWPANLRLARAPDGVWLIGELRWTPGEADRECVENRLRGLADGTASSSDTPPPPEEVATVLSALNVPWTERDDGWSVAMSRSGMPELTVKRVGQGVEVQAQLAAWEQELPTECRRAVGQYLVRAQGSLRFVRFDMTADAARVVSRAATDFLDTELPDALRCVAYARRRTVREVRTLTAPALADAYLARNRPRRPK